MRPSNPSSIWVANWLIKSMLSGRFLRIFYLNGFGFGISFDWSSQTGAGSRNGGCGDGIGVVVGGLIGPVFVLKSTRIVNAVETNIDNKTNRGIIIWNDNKTNSN